MSNGYPAGWPNSLKAPDVEEHPHGWPPFGIENAPGWPPDVEEKSRKGPDVEEVAAALFLGGGSLVEKNTYEAVKWLKLGAIKGNRYCQLTLGTLFENGDGVEKDLKKARELYRQASAGAETALEAAERLKAIEDH